MTPQVPSEDVGPGQSEATGRQNRAGCRGGESRRKTPGLEALEGLLAHHAVAVRQRPLHDGKPHYSCNRALVHTVRLLRGRSQLHMGLNVKSSIYVWKFASVATGWKFNNKPVKYPRREKGG